MQYRLVYLLAATLLLASCSSSRRTAVSKGETVQVALDLVNVQNDQVRVSVTPPAFNTPTATYQLAKIIPGTYAIADYGRYVSDFRAVDKSGKALPVSRTDSNTWVISGAESLARIEYLVDDTYDSEGGNAFGEGSKTIFSPAGTNILAGKNFVLNLCGFAGYFTGKKDIPYSLRISHPENLQASSSLDDEDKSAGTDLFRMSRYAELVDHPIMYASPDIASTKIGDMDVLLSVYSPRKNPSTLKPCSLTWKG
jgi:predicted metalloprotease with PDZ domain